MALLRAPTAALVITLLLGSTVPSAAQDEVFGKDGSLSAEVQGCIDNCTTQGTTNNASGPVCVLDSNITLDSDCVLFCYVEDAGIDSFPAFEYRACNESADEEITPDPSVTFTTTTINMSTFTPCTGNDCSITTPAPTPQQGLLQIEFDEAAVGAVNAADLTDAISTTFSASPYVATTDITGPIVTAVVSNGNGVFNITYYTMDMAAFAQATLESAKFGIVVVGSTSLLTQYYDPHSTRTTVSTQTTLTVTTVTDTRTFTTPGVATDSPTAAPTAAPTVEPTASPTAVPTAALTAAPSAAPTSAPTLAPTFSHPQIEMIFTELTLFDLGTAMRTALASNITAQLVAHTPLTGDNIDTVLFSENIPGGLRRQRRAVQGIKATVLLVPETLQQTIVAAANVLTTNNLPFLNPITPVSPLRVDALEATFEGNVVAVMTLAPTQSPTTAPTTASPTAATINTVGGQSSTGGDGDEGGLSTGATIGVIVLVLITLLLIGLAIRRYREPEPWRKNGNFAKLLTEDEEGRLARSPDDSLAMQLKRETDLDLHAQAMKLKAADEDAELLSPAVPIDGGYLESMAPTAAQPHVVPTAKASTGKINMHPTLRKEDVENKRSQRTEQTTLIDLEENDVELEAVYPVAGAGGELQIAAPGIGRAASQHATAITSGTELKTAAVAQTTVTIEGSDVNETRIDAVSLSRSPEAESSTDGGTGDATTGRRSVVNVADVDPLNMDHLVKHGLVDAEEAFKEAPNQLVRDGFARQSQC